MLMYFSSMSLARIILTLFLVCSCTAALYSFVLTFASSKIFKILFFLFLDAVASLLLTLSLSQSFLPSVRHQLTFSQFCLHTFLPIHHPPYIPSSLYTILPLYHPPYIPSFLYTIFPITISPKYHPP